MMIELWEERNEIELVNTVSEKCLGFNVLLSHNDDNDAFNFLNIMDLLFTKRTLNKLFIRCSAQNNSR